MAIKPTANQPQTSTSVVYTPAHGFAQPKTETGYTTAPYPVINPPQLIGVDYVTETVDGSLLITFPNLPIRGSGNPINKTQNQPQMLTVDVGDLLLFEVSAQNGIVVSPRVLDTSNIAYTSPGLSNGTYKAFQAEVTVSGLQRVTIWGKLYICRAWAFGGGNQ